MVDEVRATDPYPSSRVALDLDAEGRELMEEIMSTTKEKTPLRAHPLRRHGRWVVPVAAAAAVAAVVAGGVVLRGGDDGASPANNGPASSGKANPSKQKPAQPKQPKSDPGLPPTAENLTNVLLTDRTWKVTNLNASESDGALSWGKNGSRSLQVTWYPADQHQAYLDDRRREAPGQPTTILGQEGEAFHIAVGLPKPGEPTTYSMLEESADADEPRDGLRVMTILPPLGDFFLEFDAFVTDEQEYDALVAALTRVDRDAWLAALDRDVVVPSEGEAFLTKALRGVPMPPGVTVTVADLGLPQSDYHARINAIEKPLCGWAKRYYDGDQQSLGKLQASEDWPTMRALDPDGGYASLVKEFVQEIDERTYQDFRQGLGCA